jgi:hypothetical protein
MDKDYFLLHHFLNCVEQLAWSARNLGNSVLLLEGAY